MDMHCVPAESAPMSPLNEALGIFLVVATVLAVTPQVVLIMRKRSSAGVSVLTPALALIYGYLNVCATTLVKWPALRSCAHNFGGCTLQLLDFWQQAFSAIGLATVLILVVAFPPNASAKRRLATIALLLLLAAIGLALCLLSAAMPCAPLTLSFADAASIASSVVVVVAFAPQLLTTWRARGEGALSYTYYLIQSVGCLLVVFFQVVGAHDPIVVWAPPLAGAIMQGAVLVLGAFFRCRRPQGAGGSSPGDDAHGMLSGSEGAQTSLLDAEAPSGGAAPEVTAAK